MADLLHLHPRLRQIVMELGGQARVVSAARATCCGPGSQQYLFDNQNRPGFNPANPPGKSNHEYDPDASWPSPTPEEHAASSLVGGCWAIAVDFVAPYPHGHPELCFPIRDSSGGFDTRRGGEPWHGQLRPVCTPRRYAGMWRELPAGFVVPPKPDRRRAVVVAVI